MSVAVRKHIEELEEEERELLEVQKDIADTKADISVAAVVTLLKSVKDGLAELCEGQYQAEYFEKGVGDKIAAAITALTQIDHKIEIHNSNVVDVHPIASAIRHSNATIMQQNESLMKLVEKLNTPNGQTNDALYDLVCSMVQKQCLYIERGMKELDYTTQLDRIAEKIQPRIKRWQIEGQREANGRITIIATAKE
jgi:hypothetical protein